MLRYIAEAFFLESNIRALLPFLAVLWVLPAHATLRSGHTIEINPVAIHQPGQRTWRYDRDGLRVDYEYDPDPNHNVTKVKWGQGGETRLKWDAQDRLVEIKSEGNRPITRSYNRDGQLITEQQGGEVLRWSHDQMGRLSGATTSWDAKQTYGYTPKGLSQIIDPTGGEHRFTHDGWSRRNTWTQAGGVVRSTQYDDLDRLIGDTLAVPGGDIITDRRLVWSDDHTVTGLSETQGGHTTQHSYRYDAAGRLTAANTDRGQQSWTYDDADNLVAETSGAKHTTRTYQADRLLSDSHGYDYRYDSTGRLVAREGPEGTLRLWFDDRDRLIRVHTPDDRLVHHRYDALGRRAETLAEHPDGSTREEIFYWQGDNLARRVLRDPKTRETLRDEAYTYDPEQAFRPLFRVIRSADTEQVQYYSTDQRGAVVRLSDESGAPLWRAKYDPYGRAKTSGHEDQPIRLMGQLHDAASNLGHHRFRVFDPESARFVSPDPLGLEGGENAFGYPVDPVAWADPLGLAKCPKIHGVAPDWAVKGAHVTTSQGLEIFIHGSGDSVKIGPVFSRDAHNPKLKAAVAEVKNALGNSKWREKLLTQTKKATAMLGKGSAVDRAGSGGTRALEVTLERWGK